MDEDDYNSEDENEPAQVKQENEQVHYEKSSSDEGEE